MRDQLNPMLLVHFRAISDCRSGHIIAVIGGNILRSNTCQASKSSIDILTLMWETNFFISFLFMIATEEGMINSRIICT